MNNKRRFFPPATGGISLLVSFAVLCLTVFALLSLATVQANGRLMDASVQAVADYYAADCEAMDILALLRSGPVPEGVETAGDVYFYSCPISGTQDLMVEVRLQGADYTILRWQAVSNQDVTLEDGLNVWDGGLDF